MDCISGLPDELLHDILLRLNSTRAAGRTSVLSRRWRNVWATLPQLVFDGDGYGTGSDSAAPPAASFLDSVDGALRAYSAPTIDVLDISLPSGCPAFPARRVGSWLRFASRRMARTLSLDVPWSSSTPGNPRKAEVLVLPPLMERNISGSPSGTDGSGSGRPACSWP
nr:F-box/FBD/LRR-repeat protein At2g04230-like [Setaria viridis]